MHTRSTDLILLAGLWLTGRAWDPVVAELAHLGQHATVPSLPGADDHVTTASLDEQVPFPGWEPFEGPDSADLEPAARARFVDEAVAVPAAVALATVRLGDDRRFAVPVTLVCPEYRPDEARAWLAAGEIPELQRASEISFVDIDSGHWPMITRPVELARLLDTIAREG